MPPWLFCYENSVLKNSSVAISYFCCLLKICCCLPCCFPAVRRNFNLMPFYFYFYIWQDFCLPWRFFSQKIINKDFVAFYFCSHWKMYVRDFKTVSKLFCQTAEDIFYV